MARYHEKRTAQEDEFIKEFDRNLPAIEAYKKKYHKDYEHAFEGVTGVPWPKGRSVKLRNGRGEITADRTLKSVLTRYGAPIGAAIATPFVGPAAWSALGKLGAIKGLGGLTTKGLVASMAKRYGQAALGKVLGGGGGADGDGMSASNMLRTGALGIGAATQAAGQERLNQEEFGMAANRQNIAGQSAFENELLNRAMLEERQRRNALKDIYRQSYTQGFRPGVETPAGSITPPSANYSTVLSGLEQQAMNRLRTAPTYGTDVIPELPPYTPIDPRDVRGATGTRESTLSKIGKWAGPILDVAGVGMRRRRSAPQPMAEDFGDIF